jgi:hypothetical protein
LFSVSLQCLPTSKVVLSIHKLLFCQRGSHFEMYSTYICLNVLQNSSENGPLLSLCQMSAGKRSIFVTMLNASWKMFHFVTMSDASWKMVHFVTMSDASWEKVHFCHYVRCQLENGPLLSLCQMSADPILFLI